MTTNLNMKHWSSKQVNFKDYKVAVVLTFLTCVGVFANVPDHDDDPCISYTTSLICSCTEPPPLPPPCPPFVFPVNNLSEFGATTHSVSASWLPPSLCRYTGYNVSCSYGSEVMTQQTLHAQTTMFNCTNLMPGMCGINITVTVLRDYVESEPRSITLATVPSQVTNLTECGATNDSISACWSPPRGMYDGYNVTCSSKEPTRLDANNTMFTCTNLPIPGMKYNMTVTTVSCEKEGEPSMITILALPSQVTNLTECGATNYSISACWSPPHGMYDGYKVTCSGKEPALLDADTIMFTCTNLSIPGMKYNMTVTTMSCEKEGEPSVITILALPSQVTNLTECGATNYSISACWSPPHGMYDGYKVTCSGKEPALLDADTIMFTCTNLSIPGMKYNMTVTTVSCEKEGEPSMITILALPSQVTNLTECGATNYSISACWSRPLGMYDGYKVTCSDGPGRERTRLDADTTMFTCTNLSIPGMKYNMTVTTMSCEKEGEPSVITILALPPQVTNLTECECGATNYSISACWSPPHGMYDGYKVTCSGKEPALLDADTIMFTCTNLSIPGMKYNMTVTTVSCEKEGEPSVITILARESILVPPQVTNLTECECGATNDSISACWSPPHGMYDGYKVTCSDGLGREPTRLDANTTMFTCTNLPIPGMKYNMTVTVTTVSCEKEGEPSVITILARESILAPSQVANLTECGATNDSISACWSPPLGMYDGYKVTCSDGPGREPTRLDADTTMFTCTNLSIPCMKYNMAVTTMSCEKEGEPSVITILALPTSTSISPSTTCPNATTSSPPNISPSPTSPNTTTSPPSTPPPRPPPCKYFCKMCPTIQWMLVSLLCSNTLGWISVALIYYFNKPTKTDPMTYIQNTPTDHQDILSTQRESQKKCSSGGSTQDEETMLCDKQPGTSMSYDNPSYDNTPSDSVFLGGAVVNG
ncbi:receptor-type tyrosine-protein phosphatase beta-like isoform X2 [Lytechinus pictus]|uniref:receptor-type tyrosine-protein phosphatase beta-like isoform X2 n=1 Tax=Lytechinus pictus TaxID=7653 RepID=UPI0030B9EFB0